MSEQVWRRWVDCADEAGCAREVELSVSGQGELVVRLPGGEVVRLALSQAELLRAGIAVGVALLRGAPAAAGRRDSR